MKITIELTGAQVKGLKEYIKDTDGEINKIVSKKDIEAEIRGIVSCDLQTGAISDYIFKYENKIHD